MSIDKTTEGAWIIHHTDKINDFVHAANDFEAINFAGKCGLLLSSLAASEEHFISEEKLKTLASAIKINRKSELPSILTELERQKLISSHPLGFNILGLTTNTTLEYTASIFYENEPKNYEIAVIELSEKTSELPIDSESAKEYISDIYKISSSEVDHILNSSEQIGFVDVENVDSSRKMIFNGNLFRRDEVQKINAICSSLSEAQVRKIKELDENLKTSGCVPVSLAHQILGEKLFKSLNFIGFYDVNAVNNEQGNFKFVTKPSAFSKFGNAAVEDAFDLAKAFVTSLTFGMIQSESNRGKITRIQQLMRKLINGEWVGPATAIGQDYQILELRGVIQVKKSQQYPGRFSMKLLKKDVGELALKVITSGDISTEALLSLPSASITGYIGPERNRAYERKSNTPQIQNNVGELLDILRTGL
ncbi:hypothetical protein A0J48_004950 [Sphaerospermopsis aphanizomenoides BCCUSP55]|uniref:hypothetical protein n=1 Tax=Sphaerospermopsis aphanizomenoides TaxID=459663 RepID=UPI0019039355|nr:hypothetical protein [Sphaerospermopsis aphanizomenoides]MBK1986896.1 hypothetical protein [Sphaerospermopsis aphanizomenoides BCCUSP55]